MTANSNWPDVVGVSYVELCVSEQSPLRGLFQRVLGFQEIATYPVTGGTTTVLKKGAAAVLLTSPDEPDSAVASYVETHGDSVRDVALRIRRPGPKRVAAGGCGDIIHTLVVDDEPFSAVAAGVSRDLDQSSLPESHITCIDHLALAVPAGELERSAAFYIEELGFREAMQEDVITQQSGMHSKVVSANDHAVRFTIVEPAKSQTASQVQRFVTGNQGAGVQHVAFGTANILKAVSVLRSEGLEFLTPPTGYYEALPLRISDLPYSLEDLRHNGILVDRDETGVLLQVFSRPITPRKTLFLELVERRGASGFGKANIRALYDALERVWSDN